MNYIKRHITILAILLTASIASYGQLYITSGSQLTSRGWTPDSLLQHYLIGYGMDSISNVKFNNSAQNLCSRIGYFTNPDSNDPNNLPSTLPFRSGIILCTGRAADFAGPNMAADQTTLSNDCTPYEYHDPDITATADTTTIESAVLEFDCVPRSSIFRLRYVFASEEYPNFACSRFNDVFGIFVSPLGGGPSQNVALIPGTQIPVSVNTINDGHMGADVLIPHSCDTSHASLYIDQPVLTFAQMGRLTECPTAFDGQTVPLTAVIQVTPCNWYHFKIVLANVQSSHKESAVFLEAASMKVDTIFHYDTVDICANEVPYYRTMPNGDIRTYTQSTSDTAYLESFCHVDSIVYFRLNVHDTSTSNFSQTACNQYNWNGNRIDTSGDYTCRWTGSNTYGCDSIVTLHLTVNYTTHDTVWDTCLQNQLPRIFRDTSYSEEQYDQRFTLSNANHVGCDSIIHYNLTIYQNVTNVQDSTICQRDLPLTWGRLTFTAAGTLFDTLLTIHGTDSVLIRTLHVNDNTHSSIHHYIVEDSLPYQFNGNTFLNDTINDTIVIRNVGGCDSVINFSLTVYRNVYDTVDSTVCNNHLPFRWNDTTFTVAGTQTKTLNGQGYHGVDSILTMRVHVADTTTGDTTASSCYQFTWFGNTYNQSGDYKYLLTNANSDGCDSTVTLHLTIYNSTHETVYEGVLENDLPKTFNGHVYTDSVTNDTIILPNANRYGCDSIIIYNLNVFRNIHTNIDTTICENSLPLTGWHGKTFTTAETLYDTLSTTAGADSILGLTVHVDTNTHSSVTHYVVENDLPYTYHVHTYNNDTINDTVIISNAHGCDSIIAFSLVVYRNVYDTVDSIVCNNHLPFSWNDRTFTAAGAQTATLSGQGQYGVDSILTMRVYLADTTTSDTLASVCDLITWYGNSYTSSGRYPHTFYGSNATGCDSTLYLALTIRQSTSNTYYDSVIENNLPQTFNGRSYNNPVTDTIVLHAVNSAGCDSTIYYHLTIHYNTSTNVDTTICENFLPLTGWHGKTYTTAGTQYDTLYTQYGADSVLILTLHVDVNTDTNILRYTIENNLPYTFNGHSYTGDTINDTIVIANRHGCDSTIIFTLRIYRNVYDTIDSTLCENYLPLIWNNKRFDTDNTQTATLTGQGMFGVDSIVTMNVHVLRNTRSTYYDTVIENNLPRIFNDSTFNDSISHTSVIINNNNGCDSIIDYSLHVHWNVHTYVDDTICQNQLPFTWNDSIFRAETPVPTIPYTITKSRPYLTSTGADSLVTMRLYVNPNTTSNIYDTVIQNRLPYTWEGTTFSWGGPRVKTKITSNANGCDSIITLNLHVWENVTATADSIICENELPFSWNSATFTHTDTKITNLLTTHGADSTLTMNVTVHYNSSSNAFDTIVENQLDYTYNGYIFTGPVRDSNVVITNQYGCDSIINYSLHVYWNVHDTIRYVACENNTPVIINGITFYRTNSTSIVLRAHTGADSIVWTQVTINPNTYGTEHDTVVENNLPHSYYGHRFYDDVVDTTIYIPGFNVQGCDSTITYSLYVCRNVSVDIDSTICQHQLPFEWNSQTFTSASTKSIKLYTTKGADSTIHMHVRVNPDTYFTDVHRACDSFLWINGTQYTADNNTDTTMLINHYGCDSTVALNLSVFYTVVAPERFDTICIDALPYPYEDTVFDVGTNSGLYNLYYPAANMCDSVIPYNLHIYPLPVLNVSELAFSCEKWAYQLTNTHTGDVNHITWSALPADSTLVGHEEDDTVYVSPQVPTTYTATGIVPRFECTNSQSVHVIEVPILKARMRHNPPYATPDQLEFLFTDISVGNIEHRTWTLPDFSTTEQEFTYVYPTIYDSILVTLEVSENRYGCRDTVAEYIPLKGGIIWAPDVFTPKMDENNRFFVKTYNVVNYEIFIYNREGDLCFHSTDKNEAWDGKHKGRDCPQAAYVYRIIYSTYDSPRTNKSFVGTVILAR
jgi:gliding motility-associated-like protein